MKAKAHKVIHWLKSGIIVLMLAWVMMLSLLYFASSRFAAYHTNFEQFVSNIVKHPVQVGEINIGSRGLEPIFRFRNIIIFNHDKTKKIFRINELQVGIDLIGSIFKWQVKPGLLLIRGSEISVHQDKDGKIGIVGIVNSSDAQVSTDTVLAEVPRWLFEQSRINLEDIGLKWHSSDGSVMKFSKLYLRLYNGVLQHDLKVVGKLEQERSQASFRADIKFRGDLASHTIPPVFGDVIIENWVPELNFLQLSPKRIFLLTSGDINLSIRRSKIVTKLFRQPMFINNFSGKVVWSGDNDGLKIGISQLKFVDDWLTFHGNSQILFTNDVMMPTVDMQLDFKLANLAKAKLYYPASVMPPEAVTWLDQAFVNSKPITGKMVLQGPLDKFPFDHNEGKFVVDSTIRDVQLNFDPEWPQVDGISGSMVFANRSMTIVADNARIMGRPTHTIKAVIPDLEWPELNIIGAIDVDSSIGLNFVNSCPLKNSVGRKLQDITLSGFMKFKMNLDMPLSDELEKDTKVEGDIELTDNQVSSKDWNFVVKNVNGKLHFNDDNLVADKIEGKLFDRPVVFNIRTSIAKKNDTVTHINMVGAAKVQDFEQAFFFTLQPYVYGDFDYKALLELHSISGRNVFKLHSNLRGVTVDLPNPFAKSADNQSKLDLSCYFGGNKVPQLSINYNDQINVALRVKKARDNKSLQVLAGEVKFGSSPAVISATSGLVVVGKMGKLDWSLWKDYLSKAQTDFVIADSIVRQINLNLAELNAFGQVFKDVDLHAQAKKDGWSIAIMTPNINGKIFFPRDEQSYVRGEFEKLYFQKKDEGFSKFKPQDLPLLNFTINDMRYGDTKLGKVIFVTEKQSGGIKINKAIINGPKFNVNASGEWLAVNGNQSSVFRGTISSNDVGGLLREWDWTTNVIGGSGAANFILKWPGPPYLPTLTKITGAFALRVNNGRIINLTRQTESKLGFGRVLSMLSLQSLPSRLSSGFSDLTKKGFSFNSMVGDVTLANGNATVKKLTLDGLSAHVKAYGRIGLKDKDYDLMLGAVMPQITAGMPVVGGLTGGPAGAIVGFIAERIFSSEIKKTASYSYHVTGFWDQPSVAKK